MAQNLYWLVNVVDYFVIQTCKSNRIRKKLGEISNIKTNWCSI